MRWLLVGCLLLLAVGGCRENGFGTTTWCECDALEEAVAAVDWFGDGRESKVSFWYGTNARTPPAVTIVHSPAMDAPGDRARFLEAELAGIGFEKVDSGDGDVVRLERDETIVTWRISGDELRLIIGAYPDDPGAFDDVAATLGRVESGS